MRFSKIINVVSPSSEIKCYDPKSEPWFVDFDAPKSDRLMCSIVSNERRRERAKYFEVSEGEDLHGVAAFNDEWTLIYLFIDNRKFADVLAGLPLVWAGHCEVDVDLLPSLKSHDTKGRAIHRIEVAPRICFYGAGE